MLSNLPFLSALLLLATVALAHGDEDHSTMPGMGGDESMETMGMMKMWFHFTRTDTLLFESWTPTSAGAFAGACIVLVVLGVVDRILAAVRAAAEAKWSFQAQIFPTTITSTVYNASQTSVVPLTTTKNSHNDDAVSPRLRDLLPSRGSPAAWVQPRRIERDAARAGLQAAQSALGLVLMLAVMTFNIFFLLSVVVGLALGELVFGRFGASHHRPGSAHGSHC